MNQNNKGLLLSYSTIKDGNMSFVRGAYEETLHNRKAFLEKNGKNLPQTVWMKTPHEGDVHVVTSHDFGKGSKDMESTFPVDSLITNQKSIILAVVVADCIPLTLFDSKTKTLALLHVSRHNINTIIKNTVETMVSYFSANPKNIEAQIGPSIGPCCYTWYPGKNPVADKEYQNFIVQSPTSVTLDLWHMTETRLQEEGLPLKNITNPKICTYHSSEYFSHRKSEDQNLENDYRLAAITSMN